MPLIRADVPAGLTDQDHQNLTAALHDALVEALGVPADDDFVVVHPHTPSTLRIHPTFYGISRSPRAVIIQITMRDRPTEQKRALFAATTRHLRHRLGLDPADVFISLIHPPNDSWSFGDGQAQLADQPPPW